MKLLKGLSLLTVMVSQLGVAYASHCSQGPVIQQGRRQCPTQGRTVVYDRVYYPRQQRTVVRDCPVQGRTVYSRTTRTTCTRRTVVSRHRPVVVHHRPVVVRRSVCTRDRGFFGRVGDCMDDLFD